MRPYFTDMDLDILEGWCHAMCCLDIISFDEFDNIGQDLVDIAFEMDERDQDESDWEEFCAGIDDELEDDYT